jgi:hypothetical protein
VCKRTNAESNPADVLIDAGLIIALFAEWDGSKSMKEAAMLVHHFPLPRPLPDRAT